MSKVELILGDCLEKMKDIETGSIDLIITSPPYFNAKKYSYWKTYEDYIKWCERWVSTCMRVLVSGRMLCINVSAVIIARESRNTRSKRYNIPGDIHTVTTNDDWWFAEDLIWEKPEGAAINRNQRFSVDRHPMQWRANPTTEHILVYQKPTVDLNDKIIKNKDSSHRINGSFDRGEVLRMSPSKAKNHPATFPIILPEKLITYYSWPYETVLDFCMGSGTTGVAAKRLNRNFIGIEKVPEYFEIAKKRIADE